MTSPPYKFIRKQMLAGKVIPFLGSGASAAWAVEDKPDGTGNQRPGDPQTDTAKFEQALQTIVEAARDGLLNLKNDEFVEKMLQTIVEAATPDAGRRHNGGAVGGPKNEPTARAGEANDPSAPEAPPHLPSAAQLARLLADQSDFPSDEPLDLAKVAQFYKVTGGRTPLYEALRQIFVKNYSVTSLHTYLAEVAQKTPILIITTNYDDLIEKAFEKVEYDIVTHICDPKLAHVYWQQHRRSASGKYTDTEPEKTSTKSLDINLSTTSVIYKMHGAVDRRNPSRDQYLIAEDDYVDFLTSMTRNRAVPPIISEVFKSRHFLFLGYGLKDWNLRVMLNRIQQDSQYFSEFNSWAIQYNPSPLETRFWGKRGRVDVFDIDLKEFIRKLSETSD